MVVKKDYFDKEGCIESTHYSDYHFMPEEFEEVEESSFIIHALTVAQARVKLKEMGFTANNKIKI